MTVGQFDLCDGWHTIKGTSHRNWEITLAPDIRLWAEVRGATIREDFMHDDYPCYFHFTFTSEFDAEKFIEYLKEKWPRSLI